MFRVEIEAPKLSSYDAIARHEAIEKLVVREARGKFQERKYWRFRTDRWYGGIVTADAVGCGLMCKYCWVSDSVMSQPAHCGKFYRPDAVAEILVDLAERKKLGQVRISGGEPTIGMTHLLQLLDNLEGKGLFFILETNGVLIGKDAEYAFELANHSFVRVRVSLKGCNENEFMMLTGACPEGFLLQLKALENLVKAKVKCHPAVMMSFSTEQSLQQLVERLKEISYPLVDELEIEGLILYPKVKRRIDKHGLKYNNVYEPARIAEEKI